MHKEHIKKQQERKEDIERKKAVASEIVNDVSNGLVNHLNDG